VFYLVHVALAALLLAPRPAWLVAMLTSLAFGSLFVLPSRTIDPHAMQGTYGEYLLSKVSKVFPELAPAVR